MNHKQSCILDVETANGSWSSFPEGFDLLLIGLRVDSDYMLFTAESSSLEELQLFLKGFRGNVVTYSGTSFDLPLLNTYLHRVLGLTLEISQHFDILEEIKNIVGFRISLDRVSQYTFGGQKIPWNHRSNMKTWLDAPEKQIDYNRVDLDLTFELYQRVLARQHLFLGNTSILLTLPQ